jgi:hypothetical protein
MELTEKMISIPFHTKKQQKDGRISTSVQKLPLTSAKLNEIIDADFLHHFPIKNQ